MKPITFAIGDVHGCFSKMEALLAHCAAYAAGRTTKFVFLGDYIDRGPDSMGVVAQLMTAVGVVCLKGNHEDMLIETIDAPLDPDWWLSNGGAQTAVSYGATRLADIPADHVAWMKALPLFHDDGLRFFVHAGIDPTIPLNAQSERTMLWTRDRYPATINPGRLIVHGHTPLRHGAPDLEPYRLNLDTGAVFGGPLTAAAFDDTQAGPLAFITDAGGVSEMAVLADQLGR
jgi:serine/threonine protein phosphatase 1